MDGVILTTVGVIPITDGALPITVGVIHTMDLTGRVIIEVTGTDITMGADIIIPHHITTIRMLEDGILTVTVIVVPGLDLLNMVPEVLIPSMPTSPASPAEGADMELMQLQLALQQLGPDQL
jgi:hypothetical protein